MDSIQTMKVANSASYRSWLHRNISKDRLSDAQLEIVINTIIAHNREKLSNLRTIQEKTNQEASSEFANWNKINIFNKFLILFKSSIIVLLIIFVTFFLWRINHNQKLNLIFALPRTNNKQKKRKSLSHFLSENRIPINKKYLNIVQNKNINLPRKNSKNIKFVMSIDLYMISLLNFQQRKFLIRKIKSNYFYLLNITLKNNASAIAFRQLILEIPIAEILIKLRVIDCIITTNSAYVLQHSLFYLTYQNKEMNSIMLWYSENSFPKVSNFISSKFDYTYFKNISVKQHLVWTIEFKKFLSKFTTSKITPIGSILFYPKNNQIPRQASDNDTIDVLIFDVTPQSNIDENQFYTSRRMKSFINSILQIIEEFENRPVRVALKPKRKYSRSHDKEYIRFIKYLSRNKILETLDYEINLYDAIKCSRIVIGIPFTSAILIAKEMNVPCCFFNGSSEDTKHALHFGIPVYNSSVSLKKFLLKHMEFRHVATK